MKLAMSGAQGMNRPLFAWPHFIFLMILLAFAPIRHTEAVGSYAGRVLPWLTVSLLLYALWVFASRRSRTPDLGLWFIGLSYPFMFGYVLLHFIGYRTNLEWNPGSGFSEEVLYTGAVFVLACIHAFSGASILVSSGVREEGEQAESKINFAKYPEIGWICLVVGFLAHVASSMAVVEATQSAGSYANYSAGRSSGLLDDLSFLFVPGVVYLLIGGHLSRIASGIILSGSTLYLLAVMTLSGSRKGAIFAIVTILLAFIFTRSSGSFKVGRVLAMGVFSILFLNLIYTIRQTRFDLSGVVPAYFESLENFEFMTWLPGELLAETGLTFYSVTSVIATVPAVFPYEYGMMFVRTIPAILPIGWLVGDFFMLANSTEVINRYTGLPVGSSFFGDLYWNFGFHGGVFGALLLGAVYGWLRRRFVVVQNNPALYFVVFYSTLMGVRTGFFEVYRVLCVVLIGSYFLLLLARNYRSLKAVSS